MDGIVMVALTESPPSACIVLTNMRKKKYTGTSLNKITDSAGSENSGIWKLFPYISNSVRLAWWFVSWLHLKSTENSQIFIDHKKYTKIDELILSIQFLFLFWWNYDPATCAEPSGIPRLMGAPYRFADIASTRTARRIDGDDDDNVNDQINLPITSIMAISFKTWYIVRSCLTGWFRIIFELPYYHSEEKILKIAFLNTSTSN